MPDDDPLDGVEVPPVCDHYPACEGDTNGAFNIDEWRYAGSFCTWPACCTPPTEGSPHP